MDYAANLSAEQVERLWTGVGLKAPVTARHLYFQEIPHTKAKTRKFTSKPPKSRNNLRKIALIGKSMLELLVREEKAGMIIQGLQSLKEVTYTENFNPFIPNNFVDGAEYSCKGVGIAEINASTAQF